MASLRTVCEHCGAGLKVPSDQLGKKVRCPKCIQPTVVKESTPELEAKSKAAKPAVREAEPATKKKNRCPACLTKLPPGSVFCTNCGFDFRTNQQVKSSVFQPHEEAKKPSPVITIPTTQSESFERVSSSEILSAAFDIEYVLTETIILTIWSLVWGGMLGAIFAAMFMSMMGVGGIFQASILIASIIKLWMDAHDLSMWDFFKILAAVAVVCVILTFTVNGIRGVKPLEPGHIPWLVFFILEVLFLIVLRIIAFYYGRYFAICRRSALRRTFADEDSSMLADLLPGVVIWLIGYGPSLIVSFVAFQLSGDNEGLDDVLWIVLFAVASMSIVWQVWYVPMAIGAWSVKQILNPIIVIRWSLQTFSNYLCVIAVYGPLVVGSRVASYLISHLLVVFAKTLGPDATLIWLGTWIISLVLDQYIVVVMCVAMGLVLRGNERELRWRSALKKNLGI